MKNAFEKVVIFGGLGYFVIRTFFKKRDFSDKKSVVNTKTGSYLSPCGTFKFAPELIKWSKESKANKDEVKTFQQNVNVAGALKSKSFKKISVDGIFGACTYEAAKIGFPISFGLEPQNAEQVINTLTSVNALLRGNYKRYINAL